MILLIPNRPEPPSNDGVRKCMQSNKSKGTSPELLVRSALRESGFPGYRLNYAPIPGRPDICYPGRKIAIFVNGCFWHRCPRCNLPIPKHNSDFWIAKFDNNIKRDIENKKVLESMGWTVFVIWECDIKADPNMAISPVLEALTRIPHH